MQPSNELQKKYDRCSAHSMRHEKQCEFVQTGFHRVMRRLKTIATKTCKPMKKNWKSINAFSLFSVFISYSDADAAPFYFFLLFSFPFFYDFRPINFFRSEQLTRPLTFVGIVHNSCYSLMMLKPPYQPECNRAANKTEKIK